MISRLLWIAAGLAAGNYSYQAMYDQLWLVALERTYFDVTAIALVGLSFWMRPPKAPSR